MRRVGIEGIGEAWVAVRSSVGLTSVVSVAPVAPVAAVVMRRRRCFVRLGVGGCFHGRRPRAWSVVVGEVRARCEGEG